MNKKLGKLRVVAVLITTTLGTSVFADEASSQASLALLKKTEVKEVSTPATLTNATSEATSLPAVEPQKANSEVEGEAEIDAIDQLNYQKQMGAIKLEILTQKIAEKQALEALEQNSIQDKVNAAVKSMAEDFMKREEAYKAQIAELQSMVRNLEGQNQAIKLDSARKLADISATENKVFVTKVFGLSNNMKATVYFNEKVTTVRAGSELSPTLKVAKIHSNGVTFVDNEEEVFVAQTNEEFAFAQTFNQSAIKAAEAAAKSGRSGLR